MVNWMNILENPMVAVAILGGILNILAGISYFTSFSAGLTGAVTLLASLFDVVVVIWIFGPKGPLRG